MLLGTMLFSVVNAAMLPQFTPEQWAMQRQLFLQAHQALMDKDLEQYRTLAAQLTEYPLYYYLYYNYFKPNVHAVTSTEVAQFVNQFQGAPLAEMLRRSWLLQLGKNAQWAEYLEMYTPQANDRFTCYAIRAHIEQGESPGAWLDKIKELWLVGKSQSEVCDPLFVHLYADSEMNDDLIWERLRYSMLNQENSLASYLIQKLQDPQRKSLGALWLNLHHKPAEHLSSISFADSPLLREIIIYGVKRLAGKQPIDAWNWWQEHQAHYAFSSPEKATTARFIAQIAAENNEKAARPWLRSIPAAYMTDSVHLARLHLALLVQDWAEIAEVAPQLTSERNSERWQYWLARALEQTGKTAQARNIYANLAKVRDFYGFLAADQIGQPHALQAKPLDFQPEEENQLYRNASGILRAREFYQLGFMELARLEWREATQALAARERAIAAKLARDWCWYDRAIVAAVGSDAMNDLEIRFPLAFRSQIEAASAESEIPVEYAYGTIRQESAFMTFVHSSAGAMGLMQLMPATADGVAKSIGLEVNDEDDVKSIYTNLRLGTAYLRRMLDRFDDNPVLASTAYNAGPGRAVRWLNERGCLPTDVWIELIPFDETRNYVKRVLEYASVYRQRLGLGHQPLPVKPLPERYCETS